MRQAETSMRHDWLSQRAASSPHRVAIVADRDELTYAELEARAAAFAQALRAEGLGAGTLVGIELPPSAGYAVAVHSLIKLGAIVLPLSPAMARVERSRLLDELAPERVIDDPDDLPGDPGAERFEPSGNDDAAALCTILTSGTSGRPRPVTLSYGNVFASAVGSAFNLGVDPADRWLCCLPLHHVSGLSILLRSVVYGTCALLHDGFDAEAVAATLDSRSATLTSLVPTQLDRLLDCGADLSSPRVHLVGGGPLGAETLERAERAEAPVVQTYGLTEAASQVTTLAPEDARRRAGSAGRPLLTTEVAVDDGQILVRGPTVAPGLAEEDGWLRTGDRGRLDEDGYLYVDGRLDAVIVTGGENVMPEEVEAALLEHPAVAEAAVFGRTDRHWGEAVEAAIVPRDGVQPTDSELRAHCATRLSGFKVPKRFQLVARLPRTASGKLLRGELR